MTQKAAHRTNLIPRKYTKVFVFLKMRREGKGPQTLSGATSFQFTLICLFLSIYCTKRGNTESDLRG